MPKRITSDLAGFAVWPALTLVVEAAGAACVVADPAMPELAAKAVPATSVVAVSAAANVLNMVRLSRPSIADEMRGAGARDSKRVCQYVTLFDSAPLARRSGSGVLSLPKIISANNDCVVRRGLGWRGGFHIVVSV